MIYQSQEEYIDLSKLEYISKVYDYSKSTINTDTTFNYQVNGKTYTIGDKDVNKVIELRENLLKKWQEFKQNRIYLLNNDLIDLNKLERVSDVHYNEHRKGYDFRYSVNGFTWDVCYYYKDQVKKIRDNLLKSWYLYKGVK